MEHTLAAHPFVNYTCWRSRSLFGGSRSVSKVMSCSVAASEILSPMAYSFYFILIIPVLLLVSFFYILVHGHEAPGPWRPGIPSLTAVQMMRLLLLPQRWRLSTVMLLWHSFLITATAKNVEIIVTPNFVQIGPSAAEYWRHIQCQDVGSGGSLLLLVMYLMMSLSSEGQNLSANQISSMYLNPWLRYNYFQFGKNKHPPYILLPVSTRTISPQSPCHSASVCQISSTSDCHVDPPSLAMNGYRNVNSYNICILFFFKFLSH